jgi:dihydrofolate synthase/folylpolyglutamate synthase
MGEPTEFEILTALALGHLVPRVDRLVCEVGMGGRLDATNVLDLGVAVITNVALDHMQYLGNTIEAIAAEKAAIIKPGNTVVSGCRPPAREVVERAAKGAGAVLWQLDREWVLRTRWLGWEGTALDVVAGAHEYRAVHVRLLGRHQALNAALAIVAAQALGNSSPEAVKEGVASTRWPGRLELVGQRPRVLLDGGHNPDGLRHLGREVRLLIKAERLVIVFGAMADKDLPAMCECLKAMQPDAIVFTAAESAGGRAAGPAELARLWGPDAETLTPAVAALERGRQLAGAAGTVLACGSLYLVGELRPALVTA